MLIWALLTLACQPQAFVSDPDECPDSPPDAGQVRARRIVCATDIPSKAEAKLGDWLIENSRVRLTVRNTPNRLTQLGGGRGTIIDAALWDSDDALVEIVPHVTGGWPEQMSITTDGEAIALTAEDGSGRKWWYRLYPDGAALQFEGGVGFTVVPAVGSTVNGQFLDTKTSLNIAASADLDDEGGWVHWRDTDTLYLGDVSSVAQMVFADTVLATGSTDGTHLEVRSDGELLYTAPVLDGQFSLKVPPQAKIQAVAQGYLPSPLSPPTQAMTLEVGAHGFLTVAVFDEAGDPIPAMVYWNDTPYAVLDQATKLPVGPGLGVGFVDAGPEYFIHALDEMDTSGEPIVDVVLRRAAPSAAWVDFGSRAHPDPTERSSTKNLLGSLAAQGVDLAIFSATDEVAQISSKSATEHLISVLAGSRSGGPDGAPTAWPWSKNAKNPAHGAIDWHNQNPVDLLALMSKSGRRTTSVDAKWIAEAGPVSGWDPLPHFIHLNSLDDLPALSEVLDQWLAITVVGDRTWVEVDRRSSVEIQRGLFEGRSTASTGPQLTLLVDGQPPGSAFDALATRTVFVDISGISDVTEVYLLGPGHQRIATWAVNDLPATIDVDHGGWTLAVAEGPSAWAVTSPVWLSRP